MIRLGIAVGGSVQVGIGAKGGLFFATEPWRSRLDSSVMQHVVKRFLC